MKPTLLTLPKRLLDAAAKPAETCRPQLTGAYVDAAARRVVATNGRVMAMIPIPGTEPVVGGFISAELWKMAKVKNAKGHYLDYAAGTLNGLPLEPPNYLGEFPPYASAIPGDDPAYRFHLDPDFITSLAAAMGHDKVPFTLEFSANGTAPVRVTMADATGLFLPVEPHSLRRQSPVGLLAPRPAETSNQSDKSDKSDSPRLNVHTLSSPSEIIPTLQRIAADLRRISNMETEAPRLIRDYLELVPAADLDAQDEERDEALATAEKAAENAEAEAETLREKVITLELKIETLTEELETAKANATETATPPEESFAETFKVQLFQSQARVRELETQLDFQKADFDKRVNAFAAKVKDLESRIIAAMAAHPVKPLDKAPPVAPQKGPKEKPPVPMATRPPVLSRNAERNGIELRFDGKPDDATRETLKSRGWRWLPGQPGQPWAVRYSEEEYLFANHLATGDAYTPMPGPVQDAAPVIKAPANLGFLEF